MADPDSQSVISNFKKHYSIAMPDHHGDQYALVTVTQSRKLTLAKIKTRYRRLIF
ncbi:unnamed protein product [Larinioides sclopetarius]|uniref:Uncharacterized protein n=1 Tax=Larinioides sclopetarius TaxID=280406 RepID=A0AAV1YRC4_9ARAC